MRTGSSRIHLVPSGDGGWELRELADGRALERRRTESQALASARAMLVRGRGGEIVVHRSDGAVVETVAVPASGPKPWWYVPPRALFWVLGLLVVGQAVLHLIEGPAPGRLGGLWWWVMLLLGLLYLAAVARSRHLDLGRGESRRAG